MADSRRLPIDRADDATSRDRQIDALLDEGLERYFNNRYEDAIHVWTRVLFLDRTHARARAYIDRARTAQAEAHRTFEEKLHASRVLLEQGDTEAAGRLLAEAVATTGDDLHSAALRAELERRERARPADVRPGAAREPDRERWYLRRPSPGLVAVVVLSAFAVLLGGLAILDLTDTDRPSAAAPLVRGQAAPPTSSAVALVRARALVARGRLSEALIQLDGVSPVAPERARADALRIEIQQLLLASVRSSSSGASKEAVNR